MNRRTLAVIGWILVVLAACAIAAHYAGEYAYPHPNGTEVAP